ncbi:adenylate/guanylate cyclase domain-containing protein [Bradyrhizobium sp. 45]|uniref:adenylate/guanylate cyclase domain-containing protein n=1 Tax=Bradyrhizobium sp. 45 TaxID=1043587 RepID=UPI001FFA893C|nr:adenylate/guanylate cyclase domain-containing protein [Bradyrhizobium sp. 45]MCK1309468.1 hypothetical protein [Bradyrhizobium sp. 45]
MSDEGADKGEKQNLASERSGVLGAALVRQETVVLLVDLVESVRLMRQHEGPSVRRWADFVRVVLAEILPRHRGLLVKSLGDGLMARFEKVPDAVDAAAEMHRTLAKLNTGIPEDQHFHLRAGINAAFAWSDGIDIYGTGVNLAARLATLAGPGETIASASAHEQLAADLATLANPGETIGSAAARDELTHGVDATCEDLGECILKHFDKPIRAYRVGPPSPHPSLTGRRHYGVAMEPTIAIIPFGSRNNAPEHFDVGNLIADSVIWRLSKATNMKVISRLSTNVFRDRASDVAEMSAHLGATYILSGGYVVNGGHLMVTAELSVVRTNQVVWSDRLSGEVGDLLQPESELAHRIAQAVHLSVFDAEVEHVLTQPLPTLESYSLLLGSIKLMHRYSSLNFIVPAYYCRGSRTTISVRLWRADDGPMSSYHATTSSVVTFLAVPAPRVSLVRVNWTDAAGNVTKPSDASMLATTSLAERILPFPYLETTILGLEENRSGAFAAPPAASGGCNLAWQSLLSSLPVTKIFTALFGLGDIVFGMVPNAVVPPGGGGVNSGCSIGSAGCIIGFNTSFAHELGHQYGRSHVAVAGDASSDPNYPNFGGDTKSIGEVGIDTGTSPPTLFDPATSDDLMSYGQNQWISPYTYQKILDGWDSHAFVTADARHVRSILVVGVRLHRGVRDTRRVEIRQAHLVAAAGLPPKHIGATMSPLSIDLLDGSGKILATHHCFYVPGHGGTCGCGCGSSAEMVSPEREPYLDMHEAIELPGDEVAALSFHRGGEPFARLEAGGAPRVEIAGPERRDGSLAVQLQTQASLPGETSGDNNTTAPVSVVVLFSGDDGVTWQPVAVDPPNGEVLVDADRLPGGERCRFRAVATAGLRAAHADTEPFKLAPCRRKLHLDLPDDKCSIKSGAVALRAFVDSRGRGAPAPQEIRWTSSLEGELGFGRELVAQLGKGHHEITATAPDGIGGSLTERGIIIVSGKPHRPEVR